MGLAHQGLEAAQRPHPRRRAQARLGERRRRRRRARRPRLRSRPGRLPRRGPAPGTRGRDSRRVRPAREGVASRGGAHAVRRRARHLRHRTDCPRGGGLRQVAGLCDEDAHDRGGGAGAARTRRGGLARVRADSPFGFRGASAAGGPRRTGGGRMTRAFLEQWQLYRRGAPRPALCGLPSRAEGAFDADAKAGEVRIFADTNHPLVALVVADLGLSGRRIVPVSPFSAPASPRELMVGERIYQLWNATVVSRRFSDRSWLVASVAPEELEEIRGAIAAAAPGRLVAGDGVQAKYEREFLISEGNLISLAGPSAVQVSRFAWLPAAMKLAACFALCVCAWWVLMMDSGRQAVRTWTESVIPARIAEDAEPDRLSELSADTDRPEEPAEVNIDFAEPAFTWVGAEPAPKVETVAKLRKLRAPELPKELERKRIEVASVGAAPLAAAPKVEATLTPCPWNRDTKLLRISGEAPAGVKVTLEFVTNEVEGYRTVSSRTDGRFDVSYEVMPFAGRTIGSASVRVTLIWPSEDGAERTPLPIAESAPDSLQEPPRPSKP